MVMLDVVDMAVATATSPAVVMLVVVYMAVATATSLAAVMLAMATSRGVALLAVDLLVVG
jgi:hypothetical protein